MRGPSGPRLREYPRQSLRFQGSRGAADRLWGAAAIRARGQRPGRCAGARAAGRGRRSCGRALRSALELREAMATVLYAEAEERTPAPADIERLGRCFQEAERPEDLRWVRAEGEAHALLRWQWRADQLKAPGYPVWLLAQSASQLMLSDALERVSDCQADTCRWLFLDTSKNHTRRWC